MGIWDVEALKPEVVLLWLWLWLWVRVRVRVRDGAYCTGAAAAAVRAWACHPRRAVSAPSSRAQRGTSFRCPACAGGRRWDARTAARILCAMSESTTATGPTTDSPRPQALLLRRWLALFYDMWPVLAVWMLISLLFNIGWTLAGHGEREILATLSPLGALLWACCWAASGGYAVYSWGHGGQTLGMRPWRIRVTGADGGAPGTRALWIRYAVGTVSLLAGGLGFWWAWFDRDRRTWHDRASGTRLVRVPKR